MKANIDDIAALLPQIEFKARKKKTEYYNQKMQSLRGGRQFILRTSPVLSWRSDVKLTLIEYGERIGEEIVIATRTAFYEKPDSFEIALKSLERKAGCKLYYVLLISTDGEYL